MIDKLIIYQRLYDVILYAFPILNRFPKSQKFVLAQQIQNALLDTVKLVVRANVQRDKRATLIELDIQLDMARLLIRVAHDLKSMFAICQYFTAYCPDCGQ